MTETDNPTYTVTLTADENLMIQRALKRAERHASVYRSKEDPSVLKNLRERFADTPSGEEE